MIQSMKYFHIGTIIGAIAATAQLLETVLTAQGAPQQAAGSALAVAFVVIPYCLARSIQLLATNPIPDLTRQLLDTTQTQTRLLASIANNQKETVTL